MLNDKAVESARKAIEQKVSENKEALSAVGWTPGGVAAGSMVAGIYSSIGVVAAGSAFALLQSAGTAPLMTAAIGAAAGTTAALVSVKGIQHLSASSQEIVPAIKAIPFEKIKLSVEGSLKNLPRVELPFPKAKL
ncbi:hypothetical protein CPB86DRAFT_812772 [Serendipita vermifera]|nr:hypothetical protein CPB86DRAFT_812772 [Serendipita vermifera]